MIEQSKPQEAGGTRRPSNQEEQVRGLYPVITKLGPGDKWEDYGTSWVDVQGQRFAVRFEGLKELVEQAETAARIDELQWCMDILHDPNGMSEQWKRAIQTHLQELKGVSNE